MDATLPGHPSHRVSGTGFRKDYVGGSSLLVGGFLSVSLASLTLSFFPCLSTFVLLFSRLPTSVSAAVSFTRAVSSELCAALSAALQLFGEPGRWSKSDVFVYRKYSLFPLPSCPQSSLLPVPEGARIGAPRAADQGGGADPALQAGCSGQGPGGTISPPPFHALCRARALTVVMKPLPCG